VVSPKEGNSSLWINQDAYLSLGEFEPDRHIHYSFNKKGNGLYIFMINGNSDVAGQRLEKRDGIGIWDTNEISFHFRERSKVLLVEVPME
jgi:redox-sensitive bicupin YhaK (pirin superfamily)